MEIIDRAAHDPGHVEPAPEARKPVLLVDDDRAVSRAVDRILTRSGFAVVIVSSGEAAVAALERGSFDVVVSDIQMPGMSGVELLDRVRAHDLDVPVILMTGNPTLETAMAAVARGALQYLTKPTPNEILVAAVERASKLHRLARIKRQALSLLGEATEQAGDRAGLQASFERTLDSMWMAFQPIVEPALERTFAYEALVRSSEASLPHPGAILDAAERLGRVHDLGRRVRALSAAAFEAAPNDTVALFINLHTRDLLDPDLYDLASPLTKIARRVVLEITERAAIDDVKDIQARVDSLRQLGFRIAIDDLGAGYAGLSSFVALQPEIVKLDMSLIRNIHRSEVRQRLVAAMTSVAKEMGMLVTAEGIELLEERDVVHGSGCDLMQGYLFAKPGRPFPRVDRNTMTAMRPRTAASPPGGVSIGSTIDGRYELRRDLGRGAAGVVFEARQLFTGRDVAVKVVAPDVATSQLGELRTRLTREARALAAVRHPGIVEVLDGGVLPDGTPYFVMEKLTGRTLEGLIATRTKLSRDDSIAIALQLCDALEAVHRAGIVHRDLKPSNIFVVRRADGMEHVTLVDFGIAQIDAPKDERLTRAGAILGTPAYMAPEQIRGEGVDARADIYALGATLYECLTGNLPVTGNYAQIIMQLSVEERPLRVPADIEPALQAILARALARKPEHRFSTAAEMAGTLRAAFPNAVAQTAFGHPSSPRVETGGKQRRRRPRAPYVTPVRLTLPDEVIDGRTEDVSEGGLLVITRRACAPDARVNVRFALPMEGLVVGCDAHVRWSRCTRANATDGPHALGIELIDPAPPIVTSIRRYLDLMASTATVVLA